MRISLIPPLLLAMAAPAGSVAATPPPGVTAARQVLPFIEDDYARALSEARAKKVPLFIEAWAPW